MKRIGLICGGFSSEYNISLKSAQTIQNQFPAHLECVLIEISRADWQERLQLEGKIDAAIVYTHGDPGENGKIQAYLDMLQIPYVNSGVLASALSFDKWYCNQFLKGFGFEVAKSQLFHFGGQIDATALVADLGLPMFVKPSDSGSSFGISKVKSVEDVQTAFETAFNEGRNVVAEAFLDGTEVTCGVYRSQNGLVALPLTEIVSETEFFDYAAKYDGKSKEITPARVDDAVTLEVQSQAKKIYDLMGLRAIARIDFMIVNGTPHVIEVNTTPGFSPASIVPQMLGVAQIGIQDFWTAIIQVELGM
ncbi:MAG: ATP-grasp domain-containing protein [Crocinitomicaceae bacterium]|jgi:D-alanine-D-alanine ligase|nr:ATP-grasp domain-containing protein [Crocinitomicaceae bacterium]MDP4740086.1 ATP-grasp domain-containing protein [Crocinitomicaceae bacterium]MDP4799914.1 ATP-grasp domain-containing protein [Crocinitomicaceae bacterium]MDP4805626.1 ATP-grasp domain-containing protein [Crocinitomicaceae bacterium]MDP4867392.1 ATP-grasp domain-containing protein [Crocinitomicaceae bacterium]